MKKFEFLANLSAELCKTMPKAEAEKAAQYYCELIDEAVNNGEDEADFIASLPAPKVIALRLKDEMIGAAEVNLAQSDMPRVMDEIIKPPAQAAPILAPNVYQKRKKRSASMWIPFLIGAFFYVIIVLPIAFSLIISFGACFISLWAVVVSLLVAGALTPIYAAIMGYYSDSATVFFAYLAGSMLICSISAFSVWALIKISKAFLKIMQWLFRISLRPLGIKI